MHEVSICQSIINAVEEEFPEQLENIREVHLKVGLLSCVQPEFLQQVYKMMTADNELQRSVLSFERTEIKAECESCRQNFKVENYVFVCPVCNIPSNNITEGNELIIDKIILEEFTYEEVNQ